MEQDEAPCVLAMNGGSSSIKFALFRMADPPQRWLHGKLDRIGLPGTNLTFIQADGNQEAACGVGEVDRGAAVECMIDGLERRIGLASLAAVGHRVAHGGAHFVEPQRVTTDVLDELRRISAYAPEHLPAELALIDRFNERIPQVPQVVCFDTAFHRDMPNVARRLPLPRRLHDRGVQRYGFHGLSYAFLMEELARVAGADAAQRRVVLAHLGNGASLAAVLGGKSIDTSMAFTPAAGMPMSNRSGDVDPGLVLFLAETEGMTATEFHHMVNHCSGLRGVSETSGDLRDLLQREASDARAAEAVSLFCYQAKKWIGAFAAALSGLDTLVFAGGIGENSAVIRARICDDLAFLGIELDASRNAANARLVSSDSSRVAVRVIRTDEEVMIAKAVGRVLLPARTRHGPRCRSEE